MSSIMLITMRTKEAWNITGEIKSKLLIDHLLCSKECAGGQEYQDEDLRKINIYQNKKKHTLNINPMSQRLCILCVSFSPQFLQKVLVQSR